MARKRAVAAAPKTFVLELGCEELPADYLPDAMRALAVHAAEAFGPEQGFAWQRLEVWAGPRRLALMLYGLAPTVRWEKVGPSKAAAFDAQGNPTPAAQGFAKSQGVPVSALQVKETPKGPCVVAAHTAPVIPKLAETVAPLVKSLRFPKQMRWRSADPTTFARPLRWIAALYGSTIVPCRVAGLASSRRTAALRCAKSPWIAVASADSYLATIRRAGIQLEQCWQPLAFPPEGPLVAHPAPPKAAALRRRLVEVARHAHGRLIDGEETDALLIANAFLAEHPVAATGRFGQAYLDLPAEVLATSMAQHLKAFPLQDAQGRLLPTFLVVLEGRPGELKAVVAHYERILGARFADARFFWQQDTKTPLTDKTAALSGVVFHRQLGTLADKVVRVETVAGRVAPAGARAELTAAIRLAKADLVTQMVKEFPTLQGIVGAAYARHDRESADVAQALRDQYAPRTAKDPLPTNEVGTWLSLLDRVDTLTGFFGIGLAPTSSEDPFGLRRQALGLVRILVEKPLALSLDTLLDAALESWGSRLTVPAAACKASLRAFLVDRVRWWAVEVRDYSRELAAAVLAGPTDDLADVRRRLDALQALWRDGRRRERVLFAAGKVVERTGRIVQSARDAGGTVDPSKFTTSEERALWDAWATVKADTAQWLQRRDYAKASESYGTLYPSLHTFFKNVFIMDENLDIRRNRLALMREIYTLYANAVGDLCQLPLPKDL